MKILLINKFLYPKGGDAICALATGELLRARGHEVVFWGMRHSDNADFPNAEDFVENVDYVRSGGARKQFRMAANLLYSLEAKRKVEAVIKSERPDLVHLHNFAHQISPSVLHVFKKYKIPVVMTMHDYKLICASYTLLSHGKLCEKCAGGAYFNCFREGCVKDSRAKSLLNTLEMYLHHKILRIYSLVDVFISPSRFLKDKLGAMGFKKRIEVLPNFINPSEFVSKYEAVERSICYVGRLSIEKGVATLIEAVKGLDVTLKIIGDGPLKEILEKETQSKGIKNVEFLGYKSNNELKDAIKRSMFLVIPSEWYENNPRSVIESFALGKPAIGARIGGIPELVKNHETGLTFEPGNVEDLREKIGYMVSNPEKVIEMGKNARRFVEQELNAEKHYERLIAIYKLVGM